MEWNLCSSPPCIPFHPYTMFQNPMPKPSCQKSRKTIITQKVLVTYSSYIVHCNWHTQKVICTDFQASWFATWCNGGVDLPVDVPIWALTVEMWNCHTWPLDAMGGMSDCPTSEEGMPDCNLPLQLQYWKFHRKWKWSLESSTLVLVIQYCFWKDMSELV